MNKDKLLTTLSNKAGRLVTVTELCETLDLSYNGIRPKLKGSCPFRLIEVKQLRDKYNLTNDEVVELFLND